MLDTEQSSPSNNPSEIDDVEDVIEIEYERPWLYPKQEEAIFYPRDFEGNPARFSFIEAGTKTGKTVGCITWLYEQALQGPLGNYWWVAPVSAQAKIAYTRMKAFYPPETLAPLLTPTPTLTLPNGNVVWFKSGEDPDNLYGDDVQAGVIDEASRLREEAWFAVRSTLTATGGPLRFIGNVKGRRNWFYALARKAQSGERGYSYHKIVAADAVAAQVLRAEEIEQAKRDLPEHIFRELYLAEPSDDGGNPFGIAAIANCLEPLAATAPVVWGWDLAKHQDWTVGTALDNAGRTCRFVRFQKPWSETMVEIHRHTGSTPALVDSTGVGDPIVEMLQKKPGSHFEGYNFSSSSKQKLMEGLAVAIQQRAITVVADINGQPSVQRAELEDFEYQHTRTGVRYSAPEGFHDDAVMSLALAVEHKLHAKPALNLSRALADRTKNLMPMRRDLSRM